MFDPLSYSCHFHVKIITGVAGPCFTQMFCSLSLVVLYCLFLNIICPRISAGKTKSGDDCCQWLHQWGSSAAVSNAMGHRRGCWQHKGQDKLSSPAEGPGVNNQHRQGMHLKEWGNTVMY